MRKIILLLCILACTLLQAQIDQYGYQNGPLIDTKSSNEFAGLEGSIYLNGDEFTKGKIYEGEVNWRHKMKYNLNLLNMQYVLQHP